MYWGFATIEWSTGKASTAVVCGGALHPSARVDDVAHSGGMCFTIPDAQLSLPVRVYVKARLSQSGLYVWFMAKDQARNSDGSIDIP